MTVWKFATIVSTACVFVLTAFAVFLFLWNDSATKLDSHDVAVFVGAALYLELFIFTLVSFAGYSFKTFEKIRKYDDLQTMVRRVGPSDLRGILVSIALVIVTLYDWQISLQYGAIESRFVGVFVVSCAAC